MFRFYGHLLRKNVSFFYGRMFTRERNQSSDLVTRPDLFPLLPVEDCGPTHRPLVGSHVYNHDTLINNTKIFQDYSRNPLSLWETKKCDTSSGDLKYPSLDFFPITWYSRSNYLDYNCVVVLTVVYVSNPVRYLLHKQCEFIICFQYCLITVI